MTVTQLYWLITLPKIGQNVGQFLFIVGLMTSVVYIFVLVMASGDASFSEIFKFKIKYLYYLISMLVLGGLLMTFIPTGKEIVAIYGINYLTNNKDLQEIPPKLFEYANIKIDDLLEETKK